MKTELDPRFELKNDSQFASFFWRDAAVIVLCAIAFDAAVIYVFFTLLNPRIW